MHINRETNHQILTKIVLEQLIGLGIDDKVFAGEIAYVLSNYHLDLLKFNKWHIISQLVEACAKEFYLTRKPGK